MKNEKNASLPNVFSQLLIKGLQNSPFSLLAMSSRFLVQIDFVLFSILFLTLRFVVNLFFFFFHFLPPNIYFILVIILLFNFLFIFLFLSFIITDFPSIFLLYKESNGIANRQRMFLDNLLYFPFLQILSLAFIKTQDTFCYMAHWFICISPHREYLPAEDSQAYCSSSICLVITLNLSITKYEE